MESHWQIVTSSPALAPENLHIWRYQLDKSAERLPEHAKLLAPDELDRASRFHFAVHRNRYIAGRAQLRRILGSYLQMSPAAVSFLYSEFDKPTLPPGTNSSGIAFNVSHSEDTWVLAVARSRILGIDVERIRADFGGEEIAHSNFAPNEFRELLSIPESQRARAFFNCWTRKEAYVKALGAGLQIPLDSFEVTLHPDEAPKFRRGTDGDWHLLSFSPQIGFEAAVAYRGRLANPYFLELGSS